MNINIKFLEQVANEQINHPGNIQLEYENNDIIIVNTFLNEIYHDLYYANGSNQDIIMEMLTTNSIKPYYDNSLCYFKVKLVNILNSNNYNLDALCDELKIKYSWLVHQILGELKNMKK